MYVCQSYLHQFPLLPKASNLHKQDSLIKDIIFTSVLIKMCPFHFSLISFICLERMTDFYRNIEHEIHLS